ncbi:MAG: PD40 domain-containing protein [candidate division Zixibacteria bacterium]|nr:PD40 domain-containing protein [candidate division Zixibacteria bacterium]
MKRLILLIIIFFLLFGSSYGQYYFGKNKVQYTNFDWQVLTTQHFEIYFYSEEKEIAQIAANCAEESYRFLENKFNHRIKRKFPLVVYSSPNYFAQTNIIPSLLPENVGGFTEFMKGRMVIPFNGSYSNFARVIQHEMVHAFIMHKIPYVMKAHRRLNYNRLPLWFEEGLAEHWSRKWDSESDMMIRDLVISGRFLRLEDVYQVYGTFLMYKIGEAFCAHLEKEYGDDKIGLLFENYWRATSFSEIFRLTFNKSLKDVWDEWEYSLRKRYFPDIETKDLPSRISTQLTFDGINIKPEPVLFSDQEWVVFKSNKLGYSSILMMSPEGEKEKSVTLIKGERSPQFESLHLLKSKIGVSKDGKIAFVSKSHEKDVLYVYDIAQRKIIEKKRFGNLIELSSPSWSPDGQKVALVGVAKNGYSDLYLYDLQSQLLTRLTNDIYEEKDPNWSPDGECITFVSDRGTWGEEGFLNLFLLTLPENKITPLTSGAHRDLAPDWSPDGTSLVFSSDRNGSYDLYLLSLPLENDSSQISQLTSFLTGAFDPSFSSDGKTIFFTAYERYGFQIHKISLDTVVVDYADFSEPTNLSVHTSELGWKPKKIKGDQERRSVKYKNRFSFDIAQSVISYDAVYGTVGGFQAAFTDMLGNHQYFILLGNSARSTDDFFSSFNFGVTYVNKAHRVNYGYGLYHLKDEYYDEYSGFYTERQYGGLVMASYPLSKFKRVDASFFLRQSDRDVYIQNRERKALLSTNYISWVFDTSIWDYVGPIDGTRFNFTLGLTMNLNKGKAYNKLVLCDFRKYIRLKKNSCYALRVTGFTSSGKEPQRLYLGGSWSLRGYDRRAFYGRHLILLNNELRYPLIDNLSIGFPFGKISFHAIRGALFFDAGNAWEDEFDQLYGSFGIGARISLGYIMVLRFDISRTTDFKKINKKTDFDFFFGWSF